MTLFFASLALKYPGLFRFLKKFGKWLALVLVVLGLVVGFNMWLTGRDKASYARGFSDSDAVHVAEMTLANKAALRDERIMNLIAQIATARTSDQIKSLTIKLAPYQKDIENEVSSNSVYRDCVVTDGVFNSANAARGVVNASIGPGNTGRDGPKPVTAKPAP